MTTLVRARAAAGVVPHTGQAALIRLASAQRSIIEGSNDVFRVHDVMSTVGRELGVLDENGSTPSFALGEVGNEAVAA